MHTVLIYHAHTHTRTTKKTRNAKHSRINTKKQMRNQHQHHRLLATYAILKLFSITEKIDLLYSYRADY